MKYRVEHSKEISVSTYQQWREWLNENVGEYRTMWEWPNINNRLYVCFAKEEDAIAFKLKFDLGKL